MPNSRVFNLAVGSGNVAYFGSENANPNGELVRLGLDGAGSPVRSTDVGQLRAAPVIGENDKLYTINTEGKLRAWTASTLSLLWELPLGVGGVEVSPTLDCHRDASGNAAQNSPVGSLYVVADTKLYSFIVDSRKLANAPWPKFQHDARNTGNPATPVTNCP
jgi:outer membrane protein assembly factor BamB